MWTKNLLEIWRGNVWGQRRRVYREVRRDISTVMDHAVQKYRWSYWRRVKALFRENLNHSSFIAPNFAKIPNWFDNHCSYSQKNDKISKLIKKFIFAPSRIVRVGCERNGKEAVIYLTKTGIFPLSENSKFFENDDLISSPIRHAGLVEIIIFNKIKLNQIFQLLKLSFAKNKHTRQAIYNFYTKL